MSYEVCKKQMNRTTTLKGKKYVLYSESLVHPPFIVMAYRDESSSKVREYIINFDYMQTLTLGRNSSCDIKLKDSSIAKEHCELIFSNGSFLLRNLNPSLGSFMRIDSEWDFSLVDNQL